jgi:hypothetical protein
MKIKKVQLKKLVNSFLSEVKGKDKESNKVIDLTQPKEILFKYLRNLAELKAMFDLEKKHRKDSADSWSAFCTLINTAKKLEHVVTDETVYMSNQNIDYLIGTYLGWLDYEAADLLDVEMGWGVKWENWCYPESYHVGEANCQDGKKYKYSQIHTSPQTGIEFAGHSKWKEYVRNGPYGLFFDKLGDVPIDISALQDGDVFYRDLDGDVVKNKSKYLTVQEKVKKFQDIYELAIEYEKVEKSQGEEMFKLYKKLDKKLKSDRKLKDPAMTFYFVLEARDKYDRYKSEFYDSGEMESASSKRICGIRTYSCPDVGIV